MNKAHWILIATACAAGCTAEDGAESAGAASQPPAPFTAEAERAADTIDGELTRSVVAEIAADSYGGRAPGTPGDERAREYLASTMERIGFAPAAPGGGWQQPFELVGIRAMQPAQWTFAGDETLTLEQSEQFIVASGVQRETARVADAELVFVGYGIEAPEYDWDDFKGADLEGKVLVMLNNDPDWDPELFEGERRLYYGRWTYKYESAARQGAAGAIIIHTPPSAGYPWQVVQTSWTGEQFELPAETGEPRLEVEGWVTESAAQALVELAGRDLAALTEAARSRDFTPVPLGVTTSITLENTLSRTQTANVLGRLEGSDPELSDEVVVYTAHHDHLGVGEPSRVDQDDRIYNGARDNAAGVGMVLEIGRAFAALPEPPRRTILLALVGAEEQGLLGAEYFAANPAVPPGRIAANLNFDAPSIWGETRDITFIGYGKSSLDAVAERVAEYQGRVVQPDQFPDRGFFYRSDQFALAQIGVPAMYIDGGTDFVGRPEGWGAERIKEWEELHYHQPTDELDADWNFAGMAEDARFGFQAGLIVANDETLPRWRPGDEFEAAREAALESLE